MKCGDLYNYNDSLGYTHQILPGFLLLLTSKLENYLGSSPSLQGCILLLMSSCLQSFVCVIPASLLDPIYLQTNLHKAVLWSGYFITLQCPVIPNVHRKCSNCTGALKTLYSQYIHVDGIEIENLSIKWLSKSTNTYYKL